MIFTALFVGIMELIRATFANLPTLPDFPESLASYVDQFFNLLSNPIYLVKDLLTPTLFNFAVLAIIALWQFEYVYLTAMWIIRKLPFLGIK